jgi:hypothetical protein
MTTPTEDPKPITPTEPPKSEFVSREAYEKVLREKKNLESLKPQLAEYETKIKLAEEEKLKRDGDLQALAEMKAKEAEDWKSKFEQSQESIKANYRMTAVKREFEKLGADPKAIELLIKSVDLGKVQYDESTQVIIGADEEAKRIKDALPQVFGAQGPRASHDAPNLSSKPLDMESFKKLPLDEQKKRLGDLYKSQGMNFKP